MATTTSTENSGLLSVLIPPFEKRTGIKVHVVAMSSGKALKLGERGDVDLILVHAPKDEAQFVAAGFGLKRHEIMFNDFVIVGPVGDPANVYGLHSATRTFSRIAAARALFVSRGDDSGTHKKEMSIWSAAGIQPNNRWHREVGQGMGKTLQIAGEMAAYTLTDRGTWIAYRKNLPLTLLVEGDAMLKNYYSAIAVNHHRHRNIHADAARQMIAWLTSDTARMVINNYRIDGEQLFYPIAR